MERKPSLKEIFEKRVIILTFVFSLMIVFFLQLFASVTDEGTTIVNEEDFWSFEIDSTSVEIEISYTINITEGPAIDVFLFDRFEYSKYRHNEFDWVYRSEGSRLNTTFANVEVTVSGGRYYLVVDNSRKGLASPPQVDMDDSVVFEYSVSYSGDLLWITVFIVGGVLIPGMFIINMIMKYRKIDARLGPPYADIFVNCSVKEAYPILYQVLSLNGFTIQGFSLMEGRAHQGSKGINFWVNLLPYYEISFKITPKEDGTSTIRLTKSFRGFNIGKARWYDKGKIEKKFMNTVDMLTNNFKSMSWYKGSNFHRCGDKPEW